MKDVLYLGWINIYRSGLYHVAGKPGAYDRHGGDIYPTKDLALKHMDDNQFYVTTISISWYDTGLLTSNKDGDKE
jgi:hypothetical protein